MSVEQNAVPMIAKDWWNFNGEDAHGGDGNHVDEMVLIARKVHMELVAVPGRGFNFSRSSIARSRAAWSIERAENVRRQCSSASNNGGAPAATSGKKAGHNGPPKRASIAPDERSPGHDADPSFATGNVMPEQRQRES